MGFAKSSTHPTFLEKPSKLIYLATLHGVVFNVLCSTHHRQSVIGASIPTGNVAA